MERGVGVGGVTASAVGGFKRWGETKRNGCLGCAWSIYLLGRLTGWMTYLVWMECTQSLDSRRGLFLLCCPKIKPQGVFKSDLQRRTEDLMLHA